MLRAHPNVMRGSIPLMSKREASAPSQPTQDKASRWLAEKAIGRDGRVSTMAIATSMTSKPLRDAKQPSLHTSSCKTRRLGAMCLIDAQDDSDLGHLAL